MAGRSNRPLIINDETPPDVLRPKGLARGLDLEAPGFGTAEGYRGAAEPFPDSLLIPESEWIPRIREIDERKADLRTLAYERGKVTIKNQQSLPYCWIFATVAALEVLRAVQGQRHVELSPASTGAWITGFRRRGGFGREAIEGLAERGAVPVSLWPETSLARSNDTPEARSAAEDYRVAEWYYLQSFAALVSVVLRGVPGSAGYNWWGHQVAPIHLVVLDGEVCPMVANSWGPDWERDGGFGVLQGQRKYHADAVCPKAALPS